MGRAVGDGMGCAFDDGGEVWWGDWLEKCEVDMRDGAALTVG